MRLRDTPRTSAQEVGVLVSKSRRLLSGVVVLYFIIVLEVLIMISPFAVFFYAAFNPFLLFLAKWAATRWLADFFLPHMVLPPGPFLKTVRVAGSVLFVGGAIAFFVCAGQVYFNKLFRRVPAAGGSIDGFVTHSTWHSRPPAWAWQSCGRGFSRSSCGPSW